MWRVVLSNNTEWCNNGTDDCWRKLLQHCNKCNISISDMYVHDKLLDKNVTDYFVLKESTILFTTNKHLMVTKIGIGTLRRQIDKAYIDWYDELTKQKLYRQIISPKEYNTNYKFLSEIAIPLEKKS